MSETPRSFPIGADFLQLTQTLADQCGQKSDGFFAVAGKQLPKTVAALGTTLSILHRLASCLYGCKGGDHQIEWLAGKFVNQSVSAFRLIRAAQYDEALMLIRGVGEIVNLIWLFNENKDELNAWSLADRKIRLDRFRPVAVRRRLKALPIGPPIDDERYVALCEIGTHPIPGLAPNHYSGTGRPVLGSVFQEVGIFVCVNELAYAAAMGLPLRYFSIPITRSEQN